MKTALITGVNGQDGSYLAEWLIHLGYKVYGLTRDPALRYSQNTAHLSEHLTLLASTYEVENLIETLKSVRPNEVYNFAGQTHVSKSWGMLDETIEASALLPCRLLHALASVDRSIRFFQASSSEIFSPDQTALHEDSKIAPYNPYGCSKAFASHMVQAYRKNYDMYAASGILFAHESPRRDSGFAFKKIVQTAVKIKLGTEEKLALGNLSVVRDWGYAPEYVIAVHKMLQLEEPTDLVLCTGAGHSVEQVVEKTFHHLGLDTGKYVVIDPRFIRAYEPSSIIGSNEAAKQKLAWSPRISLDQLIERMIHFEMKIQTGKEKDYRNEQAFQGL